MTLAKSKELNVISSLSAYPNVMETEELLVNVRLYFFKNIQWFFIQRNVFQHSAIVILCVNETKLS